DDAGQHEHAARIDLARIGGIGQLVLDGSDATAVDGDVGQTPAGHRHDCAAANDQDWRASSIAAVMAVALPLASASAAASAPMALLARRMWRTSSSFQNFTPLTSTPRLASSASAAAARRTAT